MWTWLKSRVLGTVGQRQRAERPAPPRKSRAFAVAAEYQPLHKYLDDRFANTVVLTFAEIEDLLGNKLPGLARLQPGWWANTGADSQPSVQARSWTEASRSATANLNAETVAFERLPA